MVVALALLLLGLWRASARAQDADVSLPDLAVRLAAMTAVTGYEQAMVDSLLTLLPGASRDRAGNAVVALGAGDRRRLVVCPVSEPGFVVGGVRADGWLTLRRAPGVVSPSVERQIEGQRVTVFGRRKPLPAVVAVRSIHLTRGRGTGEGAFTVDSAYVDVGATTAAEVATAGVGVLTPVAIAKRPQRYGTDLLAAPMAGRRAACAALALAARRVIAEQGMVPGDQSVVIGFVVEQDLSGRGLATLANTRGPFTETVIVDGGAGPAGALTRVPDSATAARLPALGAVTRWSLGVRYPASAVETVPLTGADSLRTALTRWIGGGQ